MMLLEQDFASLEPADPRGRGLRGTRPRQWREAKDRSPAHDLSDLCLNVRIRTDGQSDLDLMPDGSNTVLSPKDLAYPSLACLGALYAIRIVQRGADLPPLEVVNSPRVILINMDHPFVCRTGLAPAARILISIHAGSGLADEGSASSLD